jgi:hypothetical protein
MTSPKQPSPAHRSIGGRAQQIVGSGRLDNQPHTKRSARQQHLARHLHSCGPRPVLEALLALEEGQPLNAILEDFGRLPASPFKALGADLPPIDHLVLINGGTDERQ